MSIPDFHNGVPYANQTLHWHSTDSEEHWRNNMQKRGDRIQLEYLGFDNEHCITYQFNSHGFRCDEFDDRSAGIALGCSNTMGVGLPLADVWPTMVSEILDVPVWNLGVGGCALDTCVRILYKWIDYLRPRFVMCLMPSQDRFEICMPPPSDRIACVLPSNKYDASYEDLKKVWYLNENNSKINRLKNQLVLRQLCESRGIPLVMLDYSVLKIERVLEVPPRARDLLHSGRECHITCARTFVETLKTGQANL